MDADGLLCDADATPPPDENIPAGVPDPVTAPGSPPAAAPWTGIMRKPTLQVAKEKQPMESPVVRAQRLTVRKLSFDSHVSSCQGAARAAMSHAAAAQSTQNSQQAPRRRAQLRGMRLILTCFRAASSLPCRECARQTWWPAAILEQILFSRAVRTRTTHCTRPVARHSPLHCA